MDFGLAKLLDDRIIKNVTESNFDFAIGTPGYICPEQVRGEVVDHRGDLYSVGCIFYELLTGRLPFVGPTSMDLMLAHATEPPPTFRDIGLEGIVPSAVEQVVLSCLEKEPQNRPQSAREIAERFETALAIDDMGFSDVREPIGSHFAAPMVFNDPATMSFQMEAWMPEAIAILKLKGFAHDYEGEIVESAPGLVRVALGSWAKRRSGAAGWLGFGRRHVPVGVELHLHQVDPTNNRLLIQVVFRAEYAGQLADPLWRERCTQIFIELRAYLMATTDFE
jgi:eukaryotic-like serine/threonine-protein kinase